MAASAVIYAQDDNEVTLDEVTVRGARTIQQADGQWIIPTRQQLESSTDAYSLLSKLTLPHIRVDLALGTITALSAQGSVQVRINDVMAGKNELLSLDMQGVERVEFIDNPGVRYGQDVACVINIKVRKAVSGYVLGSQLTNTLTAVNGNDMVYGKVNRGRSELSVDYSVQYYNLKGMRDDERTTYLLEDGSSVLYHRSTTSSLYKEVRQDATLTYSLSDSNYVFQAKLAGYGNIRPARYTNNFCLNDDMYDNSWSSRQNSPSLDLYMHYDFARHQSLTVNAVGTYIRYKGHSAANEITPYAYDSRGRTHALWTEAIYENVLRPFAISAGFQYAQRYSHNTYTGDVAAVNGIHTSDVYSFVQLKGHLGRFGYMAGMGISRRYYRQSGTTNDFVLFRPKMSLSYRLARNLTAKYDFEVSQHVSQVAMQSDISIKLNAMETTVGNPDLRPNRVTTNDIRLTYSSPRLTSEVHAHYRVNAHCNMQSYTRMDGHFYNTQTNGDNKVNMFYADGYNQWDLLPGVLTATVYGGVYRFFNYGPGYEHLYTSFNGGCSLMAYVKKWSFSVNADNGWNHMEGERRGHRGGAWYATASCQVTKGLRIAMYVQHPFSQHPMTYKTQLRSRYISSEISQHCRDYGNMVTLSLTYRLDHGRKYREINRTMNHSDNDAGILSR